MPPSIQDILVRAAALTPEDRHVLLTHLVERWVIETHADRAAVLGRHQAEQTAETASAAEAAGLPLRVRFALARAHGGAPKEDRLARLLALRQRARDTGLRCDEHGNWRRRPDDRLFAGAMAGVWFGWPLGAAEDAPETRVPGEIEALELVLGLG